MGYDDICMARKLSFFLEKRTACPKYLICGKRSQLDRIYFVFAAMAQISRSKTSRASIIDLSGGGGKAADGSARESYSKRRLVIKRPAQAVL